MAQKNKAHFSQIKITPDKNFYFVVRGVQNQKLLTQLTEIRTGETLSGLLTPAAYRTLLSTVCDPLSLVEAPVRVQHPTDKVRLTYLQDALDAKDFLVEGVEKKPGVKIQKIEGDLLEYTEWWSAQDMQSLRSSEGYNALPLLEAQERFIGERFSKIAYMLGHQLVDYIFEAYDNDELEYDYEMKVYLHQI